MEQISGDWSEVEFNNIRFHLPPGVGSSAVQGVDTSVGRWQGEKLVVLVDAGPFADPLTSYEGRPKHQVRREEIGGRPSRIVSFQRPQGGRIVAAHIPDVLKQPHGRVHPVTMTVETAPEVTEEIALRIIRSVRVV